MTNAGNFRAESYRSAGVSRSRAACRLLLVAALSDSLSDSSRSLPVGPVASIAGEGRGAGEPPSFRRKSLQINKPVARPPPPPRSLHRARAPAQLTLLSLQ
ncbi:jg24575 [Pararge aegeria aegeria]|uniref:Jg24575 protein n=1 Tax=Pararge aegeria aegeria TaxID=348720 RepID=A0A8S4QE51_9NEOP|nr:jg24575 [Pararge aegeria aegeria]